MQRATGSRMRPGLAQGSPVRERESLLRRFQGMVSKRSIRLRVSLRLAACIEAELDDDQECSRYRRRWRI
jgi:hypothetical protein